MTVTIKLIGDHGGELDRETRVTLTRDPDALIKRATQALVSRCTLNDGDRIIIEVD